jgi:hypothetical protein
MEHQQVALASSGVDAIEEPPCKGLLTLPKLFAKSKRWSPSPPAEVGLCAFVAEQIFTSYPHVAIR